MIQKLLILFFVVVPFFSKAQSYDKIYLKDRSVIKGKVLRVTENNIEIDSEDNKTSALINRNKVRLIIYSDNTIVEFNSNNNIDKTEDIKKNKKLYSIPDNENDIKKYIRKKIKDYDIHDYNKKLIPSYGFQYLDYKINDLINQRFRKENKIKEINVSYIQQTSFGTFKKLDKYIYNKLGFILEEQKYTNDKFNEKKVYTYSSDNKLLKVTLFDFNNNLKYANLLSYSGDTTFIKKVSRYSSFSKLTCKIKNFSIEIEPNYDAKIELINQVGQNSLEIISEHFMTKRYRDRYKIKDNVISYYKKFKHEFSYLGDNLKRISNSVEWYKKIFDGSKSGHESYDLSNLFYKYDRKNRLSKITSGSGSKKTSTRIYYGYKNLISKTQENFKNGNGTYNYSYEFYK